MRREDNEKEFKEFCWKKIKEFLEGGSPYPLFNIYISLNAPSMFPDEYLFCFSPPEEPLLVPEEVLQVAKRLQIYIPNRIDRIILKESLLVTVYGFDGFSTDILPYRLDNILVVFLLWILLKEKGIDFLEEAMKNLKTVEEALETLIRAMEMFKVIAEMVGV